MRWLCLIAMLGCGRVAFDPFSDAGAGGSASGDGQSTTDGSTTATCQPPSGGSCSFDMLPACDCWGIGFTNNAQLAVADGDLVVTPNPNTAGADGGCVNDGLTFGPGGATVEVVQVVNGASGVTGMEVTNGGTDVYRMSVTNGQLAWYDGSNNAGTTYDPVQQRFWRIRRNGSNVQGQTSPDGVSWLTNFVAGRTPNATYTVSLFARTTASEAAPGSGRFAGVTVCP